MINEKQLLKALDDNKAFTDLFPDHYKLWTAARKFPQHADALFRYVTEHADQFIRLIDSYVPLHNTCAHFPEHTNALRHAYDQFCIQPALVDDKSGQAVFKRVFQEIHNLLSTIKVFPGYAAALLQKFDEVCIQPALVNDKGWEKEFMNLCKSPFDICSITRNFPNCAEALIKKACEDPSVFDALFGRASNSFAIIHDFINGDDRLKKSSDPLMQILRDAPDFQTARKSIQEVMLDAKNSKLGLFSDKKGRLILPKEIREDVLKFIPGTKIRKPGAH